jgi:hypothetical protein
MSIVFGEFLVNDQDDKDFLKHLKRILGDHFEVTNPPTNSCVAKIATETNLRSFYEECSDCWTIGLEIEVMQDSETKLEFTSKVLKYFPEAKWYYLEDN